MNAETFLIFYNLSFKGMRSLGETTVFSFFSGGIGFAFPFDGHEGGVCIKQLHYRAKG